MTGRSQTRASLGSPERGRFPLPGGLDGVLVCRGSAGLGCRFGWGVRRAQCGTIQNQPQMHTARLGRNQKDREPVTRSSSACFGGPGRLWERRPNRTCCGSQSRGPKSAQAAQTLRDSGTDGHGFRERNRRFSTESRMNLLARSCHPRPRLFYPRESASIRGQINPSLNRSM